MELDYGSQLDPTTTIGLFIGIWLVLMPLSMITSLVYCCCPSSIWIKTKPWLKTIPVKYPTIAGDLERNCATQHQAEDGTSFIEQLINKLFFKIDYPQPETRPEKKKPKPKRKFETKNGWRRQLCKRKGSKKGTRKRPDQPGDFLTSTNTTHSNIQIQPSNKSKQRLKQAAQMLKLTTRNSKKSHIPKKQPKMKQSNVYPAPAPGWCPPQLKGRRRTLKLLHCAKRRVKKKTMQPQVSLYDKCYTLPPIPCQCHARHPYTGTSNRSEEFILRSPVLDTDDQIDDVYEYSVSKI